MSAPAKITASLDVADPATWPVRMTTHEVLIVTRYSPTTLARRRRAGEFPKAVEPGIYDRGQVLGALGLVPATGNAEDDPSLAAAHAFHKARHARKR